MDARRLRFRLNLTAAACLVAAGAIVAAAALAPFDRPPAAAGAPGARRGPPTTAATRSASRPSLESFARLDLRRPLTDAPGAEPSADPAAAAPDVRLTGTIVEPGRAYAVFVTPDGQTQVRSVGQRAGGAEVARIDDNVVTLTLDGKPFVLRVEKRAEAGGP